jgi:hypothetical protein
LLPTAVIKASTKLVTPRTKNTVAISEMLDFGRFYLVLSIQNPSKRATSKRRKRLLSKRTKSLLSKTKMSGPKTFFPQTLTKSSSKAKTTKTLLQEDIETEDALSDVAVESDYPLDEGVALGPTGRSYDSSDDAASDRSDEESVVEEVAPIRYASNPKSRDTQRGQAKAPTHTLKRAERNLRSPATYLVNPHKTPLHSRFTPVHTPCSNEKSRVTKHFRTGSQRNGRLSKVRY